MSICIYSSILVAENLKRLKAIQFFERIDTQGNQPLKLLAEDYEAYVVKTSHNELTKYEVINEFLCHYFLKLWNIETPPIAAIEVPKALDLSLLDIRERRKYQDQVCFGSQFIRDSIELQTFISPTGKVDLKRIYNLSDLYMIALFDIWIENDDRKPTNCNLLLTPFAKRMKITAIDHAYVLSSAGYLHLDRIDVASSSNDCILMSSLGQSLKNVHKVKGPAVKSYREKFYLCIKNCQESYQHITDMVPIELGFSSDEKEMLRKFLFNNIRIKSVFQEFLQRVKV